MALFVCDNCRGAMCGDDTKTGEAEFDFASRLELQKQKMLDKIKSGGKESSGVTTPLRWIVTNEYAADGRCEMCGAIQDGLTEISSEDDLNPFNNCTSEEEVYEVEADFIEVEKRLAMPRRVVVEYEKSMKQHSITLVDAYGRQVGEKRYEKSYRAAEALKRQLLEELESGK